MLKKENIILKTEQAFIPNILNSDKRTKNIDFKDVYDKLKKVPDGKIADEYKELFDSEWGSIVSSTWFLKLSGNKDNIKIWSNFGDKILPLLKNCSNFNDFYKELVNIPLPSISGKRYMSLYTWNKLVLLILYCSDKINLKKSSKDIIDFYEDFTFPYKRIFNHKDAVFQRKDTVPVIRESFQKYDWINGDFYNVNTVVNHKSEINKILVKDTIKNLVDDLNNSKDIKKIFNKQSKEIFKKYRDDEIYTSDMLSYFQNDLTKNGTVVWIEIILQIFHKIFENSENKNDLLSFEWIDGEYGEFKFKNEIYQIKNWNKELAKNAKENLVNYILIKTSKGKTIFKFIKKI